jgi:4-amino-4-deoxy-L-arabinose transferase-like glycosyltransferase
MIIGDGAATFLMRKSREVTLPSLFDRPSFQFLVLLLICGAVAQGHWLQIDTLWGDQGRTLFETYRASQGEWPYRDFSFQYPPLGLFVLAGFMKLLGPTFQAAQIGYDAVSFAVVVLYWTLARRLFGSLKGWIIALCFVLMTGAFATTLAFFSLNVYTPAVLVGTMGILLLLISLIGCLEQGAMDPKGYLLISLASTICLLSKPEFAAGAAAALAVFVLIGPWRWAGRSWRAAAGVAVALGVAFAAPASLVYAALAGQVTWLRLADGLRGYGVLAQACPYWPTGISLLGVFVALTQGATGLAALQLIRLYRLGRQTKAGILRFCLVAGFSLTALAFYAPYLAEPHSYASATAASRQAMNAPHASQLEEPQPHVDWRAAQKAVFYYFFSSNTVWMPIMWVGFVTFPVIVWNRVRWKRRYLASYGKLALLLATCFALTLRSLFNYPLDELPKVSMPAAPIVLLAGCLVLMTLGRGVGIPHSRVRKWVPRTTAIVMVCLAVYVGARFAYSVFIRSETRVSALDTRAGRVYVQRKEDADIYRYVDRKISTGRELLDLAYGGGVNFGLGRKSPAFMTQYQLLMPPNRILDEDERRVAENPPQLIIALAEPNLGILWGVPDRSACTCPRLVWRSTRCACDPVKPIPLEGYIEQHYRLVAAFGSKQILELSRD